MKKMESKKLQRPRWLDSLFGRKNSNSQWVQENLEEMNRNFRRMLTIIGDSNAVSFAEKFEMYHQSRQELINLVDKCNRIHCLLAERYNHETGEFPNSGLNSSQGTSNVSSDKISLPLLSKLRSSKQSNAPVSLVGSRQLKRGVSSIGNNNHIRGQISKKVPLMCDLSNYYSDTQSDGDDEEEELEAELRDIIEKLYIEMEGDRVVSMLQGGILRYEDNAHDDDEEFRQVRESISSNVNKALLEQTLELQAEICRLMKVISSLEEYINEESNELCESLDEALSQDIEERIEAQTLFASEIEQLKASIVKKNNDVEELNKILEAVAAERDQLKTRIAMLDADP